MSARPLPLGLPVGARPFVKFVGGKTQLLPQILERLPAKMETYYEPFVGGGAVFFALAAEGRFQRAELADQNWELIEAYTIVRDQVELLIDLLQHRNFVNEEAAYYAIRSKATEPLTPLQRAARVIYLNKTCYNGLFRTNKQGHFNVPFGRYTNPRICDPDGLRLASKALQGVELRVADFGHAVQAAKPGDVVYFDPPYHPISETSNFVAYTPYPFKEPEHERLAGTLRWLGDRGVFSLLSNSDCAFTRGLYADQRVELVQAKRAVNSVGSKRGKVSELLVTALQH